jgi:predicted RNase H-like HicB family nuclease
MPVKVPAGFFRPGEDVHPDSDASEIEFSYIDQYRVIYTHYRDTWSAHSPDVRGVFAGGNTRQEAEKRMREAIPFHLEGVALDQGGQALSASG